MAFSVSDDFDLGTTGPVSTSTWYVRKVVAQNSEGLIIIRPVFRSSTLD